MIFYVSSWYLIVFEREIRVSNLKLYFTVNHRTSDLRTSGKRKLGPGDVRKTEESAEIMLVKSRGCQNKMQYFGNSGEMLLLAAPPTPFPPLGKNAASSLKSILEEY